MTKEFEQYQERIRDDIATCMDTMGVQPILFVGSGLSRRYFLAPSWEGLLQRLVDACPLIDKDYGYYKQKFHSPIDIGSAFADIYREWAWGDGKGVFPPELFGPSQPAEIYIKYKVARYFEELLLSSDAESTEETHKEELESLQKVRPHAIITTNYDRFLEKLFPEYSPIIGQKILNGNFAQIGEILKIHGCSSEPESLVFVRNDYKEFHAKKKYLSAKLLTYFAEHPLFFLGYSAEDPNIRSILADIDEILSPHGQLIPNIYLVEWSNKAQQQMSFASERLVAIDAERSVRVKSIVADGFGWVFDALGSNEALPSVSPKILRALMARTYSLVRHDIPKRIVEVDYDTLEHAVSSEQELAKLYGITTLDDPSAVNAMYPFSLTHVGQKLGYPGWHQANQLINQIKSEQGTDIKAADNRYHIAILAGNTMQAHKYSQAAVELLKKVRDGEDYQVEI
ncbi:SIR2 family protein [Thioalkalivibrio nitratireducens]|uniref:SIR2 family protein n=1 Tax=Thioalkalivibrio nitratireducens TaxID=186931 RepID=UPI0005C244E2|nr:SIR2 family protein [Thioalkalivibrio nitratireducens]